MLITNTPNSELHVYNNSGEEVVTVNDNGIIDGVASEAETIRGYTREEVEEAMSGGGLPSPRAMSYIYSYNGKSWGSAYAILTLQFADRSGDWVLENHSDDFDDLCDTLMYGGHSRVVVSLEYTDAEQFVVYNFMPTVSVVPYMESPEKAGHIEFNSDGNGPSVEITRDSQGQMNISVGGAR